MRGERGAGKNIYCIRYIYIYKVETMKKEEKGGGERMERELCFDISYIFSLEYLR